MRKEDAKGMVWMRRISIVFGLWLHGVIGEGRSGWLNVEYVIDVCVGGVQECL